MIHATNGTFILLLLLLLPPQEDQHSFVDLWTKFMCITFPITFKHQCRGHRWELLPSREEGESLFHSQLQPEAAVHFGVYVSILDYPSLRALNEMFATCIHCAKGADCWCRGRTFLIPTRSLLSFWRVAGFIA